MVGKMMILPLIAISKNIMKTCASPILQIVKKENKKFKKSWKSILGDNWKR